MERWEIINAVQNMQNYIEAHLSEPITLKQLADSAGYSQWHSARLFKELTGKTPFDYIRMFRLSKAALVLRDEKPKVIDVAFDFVFDSHEGFTKAFSRQFGMSPLRYSKDTPPIQLFIPYRIYDYYLTVKRGVNVMQKKEKTNTVFVQVIERPARKLLLKRGVKASEYFGYCEEVGCDVWGVLTSVKEALYEPIGMWLPKAFRKEGTSEYVQGVELPLNYNNTVPEGFELVELPPCKMMVFQGPPFEDVDFMEAISDLWQVIKDYNPETYGFQWAPEEAPRFQLSPEGYRGYIEARPVRALNEK